MDIDKEVYTIETLDKLLEQINKTLPFTEKAKKERGEVFTPMDFIHDKMLKDIKEYSPFPSPF